MKISSEKRVDCLERCGEKLWYKVYNLEMSLDDFIEELHAGIHPIASITVREDTDVGMHMFGGTVTYEWIMENLWNIYASLQSIMFTFRDTKEFINVFINSNATKNIVFTTYEESLSLHEFLGVEQDSLI